MKIKKEKSARRFMALLAAVCMLSSIQTVEYGDDAETPEDPARPAEEWGSWKFTGWNGTYTMIVKDEIVQAQFEKVINRYEVIFYDAEGNVLSRQRIAHGEDLPVPEAVYETVTLKPSAFQKDMVASFAERAERIRNGRVKPSEDNMLKITTAGRKLALDQRLLNGPAQEDVMSKTAECANRAFCIWKETKAS